jgi:hypothetical protein
MVAEDSTRSSPVLTLEFHRRRARGRAQAASLSSKAGLSGRAALSAFFLEDLLAPIETVG